MRSILFFVALSFLLALSSRAQSVGVGTTTPNNSAQLDVSSTTKGMLIPRMTTAQRNAIVSPAIGLTILNLDDLCTDIYDGARWIKNCGMKQLDSAIVSAGNWIQKADFGGVGRYAAVGFSVGSKGYIGAGISTNGYKKDLWEFDPASNAWSQKANIGGQERSSSIAFSIGSKAYVGTGYGFNVIDGNYVLRDLWEYDPAANTWTQKADFAGGYRQNAAGFSIGTKGYIATGSSEVGQLKNDLWEYDPATNTWTAKANLPALPRRAAFGFSVGSKGYVGGGDVCCPNAINSDFWEYDPSTNTWTQKTNIGGTPRLLATAFSLGTKGFVCAGANASNGSMNDFWEYSPSSNTWTQRSSLPGDSRWQAAGFVIGNNVYIGTGYATGAYKNDFWQYNDQPFNVANYSTISSTMAQNNISDGIWSRTVTNDITSSGNKFKITSAGRVGINNTTPAYPLTFTDSTGDKISLSGNAPDHYGIGLQPYLMQIHGDNSSADIAFGYGSSGSFTERMRIKGNGSVGIGVSPLPGSSAILEVSSTSKGVLIPRMTTAQRNAISGPVQGLTIFNLDDNCTDIFDGSKWIKNCGLKQGDSSAIGANNWVQKTSMSGNGRSEGVSFSIGGKGYVGLGLSSTLNDWWEFDPSANAWSQKANFTGTTPRARAVSFAIGSKGYVGTGWNGSTRFNDFWEYNPATNVWSPVANFGGTPREMAVGFSIGVKGYVGTGWDGTARNDLWEFDPTANNWTPRAAFPGVPRFGAAGFATTTKGYILTGSNSSGNLLNDTWEFDPVANTWVQRPNLPGAIRYQAAAFGIGTKGYIGTGIGNSGDYKNDFWEFDPAVTGYWTQRPDFLGTARGGATGFSIGTKGYFATGWDNNSKNDIWEYNTQPFNVASYSTIPSTLSQYTISDGIWTKLANNDILSLGNKVKISNSGNVGIGTTSPAFPLSFPNTTGDKIALYGSSGNHFGLGVQNGVLQIHSDGSASDIAFGFGTSGSFTETVRMKGNGTTGFGTASPHASAIVEMSSTTKGLLIPRMSTAQRNAIASPAAGLTILNTDDYCTDIYDGANWVKNCGFKAQGDSTTVSGNNWLQKANFANSRSYSTGLSIGSKGYFVLGYGNNNYYNDLWEFDPASNSWTQKANYPGAAVVNAVGFTINGKGYVGMGGLSPSSFYQVDFWEYNPATNTWLQKANFAGAARAYPAAFAIGTKGYVGTGGNNFNDFWEFDPAANSWTQKANFAGGGRYGATGFSVGSKGYIGTGYDGSFKADLWEYDPAGNTWTQKATLPSLGRYFATSFSIGTKGYIGTGDAAGSGLRKDFWEYDPAANTWTQRPDFGGVGRGKAASFAIGTKGYIGLGSIDNMFAVSNDFWEYSSQAYLAPNYSPVTPGAVSQQYNLSDGKWTKTLSNDLVSYGDKVKIASDGNVGIGTSTPGFPLSFPNTLGNKIALWGQNGAHYGIGIQSSQLQLYTDVSAAAISFGYGNSGNFAERVRISNSGEYGMFVTGRMALKSSGIYSAGMWLHNLVNSATPAFIGMASDNQVGFYGPGGALWGLTMNTNNANVGIGLNGGQPLRPLSFPATLGEKILLYPGGNGEVGIGVYGNELRLHCDNPGSKVSFGTQDNAGVFTEAAKAQINGAYAFSIFGSLWVNGTTYASDERFKQNISPIGSPLEKLVQLKGVEYEMRTKEFPLNRFQPGRQIGLLAQNVEQVIPEAVSEQDGYKGVDYAKLVPLLIESIKEQQKQIEELKRQNETLFRMIRQ